jgi:hypothetical protein
MCCHSDYTDKRLNGKPLAVESFPGSELLAGLGFTHFLEKLTQRLPKPPALLSIQVLCDDLTKLLRILLISTPQIAG